LIRESRWLTGVDATHTYTESVRQDLAELDNALQANYEFRAMFHRVPLEQLEVSDITKVFLGTPASLHRRCSVPRCHVASRSRPWA